MNIAVCVNLIPDPEAPPSKFRVQPGAKLPEPWSGSFVVGPFDENALELALQLKDRGHGQVYALAVGEKNVIPALKKALAVKADEAIWIQQDTAGLDSSGVATVLAAAIKKIGDVGVVLCGRQSGDWDSSQVGLLLGEALNMSSLALVKRIEQIDGSQATVAREIDGSLERAEIQLPAVLTVTNDVSNQLRVAKVRDIMLAERKPLPGVPLSELGIAEAPRPVVEIRGLQQPPGEKRQAEILDGQTADEKAAKLADRVVQLIREG